MKTCQSRNNNGAALVLISVALVASGLLGSAMLASLTSARYQRGYFEVGNRALYAAESGKAYVLARRAGEPDYLPTGTYTLETGDQFILTSAVTGSVVEVTSTGAAYPGAQREAHHHVSFTLMTDEEEPGGGSIDLENVFVLGSELIFRGDTLSGPGGIVIIRGGLSSTDVNLGASLAVSTLYFDGTVSLLSGSASLGSATDPGEIYINGDLILRDGQRNIYGTVYVNGNLLLKDARIHGDMYINGDVELLWTPTLVGDSRIYYTGTLSFPNSYPQSILDRMVHQDTVPGFEMPTDFQPALHPDAWYAARGYVAGGLLVSDLKVFADQYSSTRWRPTTQNVVIVSKGDITITGLGGSGMSGVLIAPYGRVTFAGAFFEGLVLAGQGFHVTSGGTVVTFKSIMEFFDSEDDIPVTSE